MRQASPDHRGLPLRRGVELVAVFYGLGEAGENGDQILLGGGFVGAVDQFFGEKDAATGRPGAGKLLNQFVFGGNRSLADHVAIGLLGRNRDAGVLGDEFLGGGPPFLEFLFAEHLRENDLNLDGGSGVVGVALEGLDEKLGGILSDQLVDRLGVGLFTDEQMFGRQHIHGRDAERRIH